MKLRALVVSVVIASLGGCATTQAEPTGGDPEVARAGDTAMQHAAAAERQPELEGAVVAEATATCGASCSIAAGTCAGCSISCPEGRPAICTPGQVWCPTTGCQCTRQPTCRCG